MIKKLIVPVILMLALVSFAVAAPGGAAPTAGETSAGTGTSSTSTNIEGGNVTYAGINSDQATGNWAGFFGNVSGGLILSDSGANSFFEWTITSWDDTVVYATNDSITDWTGGNIAPLTSDNVPSYIVGTGTDNFTNTFNANEAFTSASLTEASTPYVETWQNGAQGTLKTYGLQSTADNANIWAGVVDDDSTSFKSATATVDYQILLPASGVTAYYFYMELP